MYRRVFSSILVPCLLLPQFVAMFAHAHGEEYADGDTSRPHMHLRFAAARRSHDHGHFHSHDHCHGHDHYDHDIDGKRDDTEPTGLVESQLSAPPEHDSYAVFFDRIDAAVPTQTNAAGEQKVLNPNTFGLIEQYAVAVPLPAPSANRTHTAPASSGYRCALYILHDALLY